MERDREMAWRDKHYDSMSTMQPGYAPETFTVEKALAERLEHLRASIIREAEVHKWDANTVDKVLTEAGLPPMTHEYIVEYIQETFQQVRVRARDKAHASEVAGLDTSQGMRLQAVHEVPEG